jgi:segregation and condensation protein B
MRLTQMIEALLFASDAPLSAADLLRIDERLDEDTVEAVIQELRAEYETSERSFQVYEVAGGYQLLTRPEYVTVLERYDSVPQPARLSVPALEVLAIIAYRQPIGRAEIEDIRGVGSSGVLRTLQERSLIDVVARGEGLGRPLLYGTTQKFLEHFGFRSLEDLPRPEELPVVLRERTRPAESVRESGKEPEPAALVIERAPAVTERVLSIVNLEPSTDVSEMEDVSADLEFEEVELKWAAAGARETAERAERRDAAAAADRADGRGADGGAGEPEAKVAAPERADWNEVGEQASSG